MPIVQAWIEWLPEVRGDPILPVVTVHEAPERTAGRLAFGGIPVDAGNEPDGAQLPMFPGPPGPHVPLLELVDRHGIPTMARGRGAHLELGVYVGAGPRRAP